MKARIIGFIFVFAILAALYVLMGENQTPIGSTVQQQTVSEPAYGNLKIQ